MDKSIEQIQHQVEQVYQYFLTHYLTELDLGKRFDRVDTIHKMVAAIHPTGYRGQDDKLEEMLNHINNEYWEFLKSGKISN